MNQYEVITTGRASDGNATLTLNEWYDQGYELVQGFLDTHRPVPNFTFIFKLRPEIEEIGQAFDEEFRSDVPPESEPEAEPEQTDWIKFAEDMKRDWGAVVERVNDVIRSFNRNNPDS